LATLLQPVFARSSITKSRNKSNYSCTFVQGATEDFSKITAPLIYSVLQEFRVFSLIVFSSWKGRYIYPLVPMFLFSTLRLTSPALAGQLSAVFF